MITLLVTTSTFPVIRWHHYVAYNITLCTVVPYTVLKRVHRWQVMRSPNGSINGDPERFPGGTRPSSLYTTVHNVMLPVAASFISPNHAHRHEGARGLHPLEGRGVDVQVMLAPPCVFCIEDHK